MRHQMPGLNILAALKDNSSHRRLGSCRPDGRCDRFQYSFTQIVRGIARGEIDAHLRRRYSRNRDSDLVVTIHHQLLDDEIILNPPHPANAGSDLGSARLYGIRVHETA